MAGRIRARAGVGLALLVLALLVPAWIGGPLAGQEPGPTREVLPNGLEVLHLPSLDTDPDTLAVLEISVRAGSALEPRGFEGLTGILATVLQDEIRAGGGGETIVWAEPDRLAIRILGSPEDLAHQVAVVGEVLTAPGLEPGHILQRGEQAASFLTAQLMEPETVGARLFVREVFAGHPYGTVETPLGLTDMERDALAAFHDRYVAPGRSQAVMSGLGAREMGAVRRVLGGWSTSGVADAPLPDLVAPRPNPQGEHVVHVVHIPGAQVATLHVGHALPPVGEEEWVAMAVGVELQAMANGRAFAGWGRFRSDLGRIPSDASLTRFAAGGVLRLRALVPPGEVERGLTLLLESMARAGTTIPPLERTESVVDGLRAAAPARAPLEDRVGRVAAYESVGLGEPFWAEYENTLSALDGFAARDALAARIVVSGATVVVVGDATRFGESLTAFGRVRYRDSRGEPVTGPDEVVADAAPLPILGAPRPGFWEYRIMVGDREVGRTTREVAPGPDSIPGSLTIRSSLTLGALDQAGELVVRERDLQGLRVRLRNVGPDTDAQTDLEIRDGRVRGTILDAGRGFEREISSPAPEGLIPGDALELALWMMPMEEGASWTVPFLDPASGKVGVARIAVLGLMEVELAGGRTRVWTLDVVAEGVRQRLYLSADPPRVTLAAELVGQPLRLELVTEPTGNP